MEKKDALIEMQKGEATEHLIYVELSKRAKDEKNRIILERIARDELKHYGILKKITKIDVEADRFAVWKYTLISTIFGLAFGLKLMENGEKNAQDAYKEMEKNYPELKITIKDEEKHEMDLINLIKDERLDYASAVVLGLNDAIVEFTGTIAGLTFALADTKIIGITGLILGISASLSMGASSFLSSREAEDKDPLKAFAYTGVAYMLTVSLMIMPYLLTNNPYHALIALLALTGIVIAAYSFYISIAKDQKFWPKFLEMVGISFGVALVSFAIGSLLKVYVE